MAGYNPDLEQPDRPAGSLGKETREAPLKRALKNQEKLLATLGVELDNLQSQLSAVCSPSNEGEKLPAETVPHMGDSPVVRGVSDLNQTIEEYIRKVTRLRNSLEI